ncbi:MAG: glycosyltransferase family 4 protein [Planctomycetota bacterium]|jgi:glycosyltransferase involved in cell wall biosynthesis
MTRVLFLAPLPPPITGQALACKYLLDDLQKSEEVEVINLMKGHYRQGFTSLGHAFRMLRLLFGLRGKAARADCIYMGMSQSIAGNVKDLAFWAVMGRHRRKLYMHLNGGGIRRTVYERSGFLRGLNRRALRRMGGIIVLSKSLRSIFAGMIAEDRVHEVANYAEDELYRSEDQVRGKHAADGPLRVLFLSNLFPDKGYPETLAAAEALHASRPGEFHFEFAGGFLDDAEGEQVQARIRAAGNAEYLGTISGDAKRDALARAHVLCLPSSYPYEGQPLCILEAYSSGCAVVTTDQGGIPDVFADGENGRRIMAGDPEQLRAALEELAVDRELLSKIGLHNRQEAEQYRGSVYLSKMRRLLLP